MDHPDQDKGEGATINFPVSWARCLTLQILRCEAETLIPGADKQKHATPWQIKSPGYRAFDGDGKPERVRAAGRILPADHFDPAAHYPDTMIFMESVRFS